MVMFSSKKAKAKVRADEEARNYEAAQTRKALEIDFKANRDAYEAAWLAKNPARPITVIFTDDEEVELLGHSWRIQYRQSWGEDSLIPTHVGIYERIYDGSAMRPSGYAEKVVASFEKNSVKGLYFSDRLAE